MGTVALLAVLVGLDNLQVGSGLGLLDVRAVSRRALAVAFGLCEGLMPLVGLVFGRAVRGWAGEAAAVLGPAVLAACGVAIIAGAVRERPGAVDRRWLLFGLPVALSFDNLLAGAGLGALGYPVGLTAVVIGGVSAAMCLAGLYLGARVRRFVPARADLLSGVYLVVVAAAFLLLDAS